MGTLKNKIINGIIAAEGGYVDDPRDSGGETNFGITLSVARACGYLGPMKDLPRAKAFDIYCEKYWNAVKADSMPESVAAEVVDTAVNCGVSRASEILQRALNVFNRSGKLYNDIAVDGDIGSATITALNVYLNERDEATLVKALNCIQGAFYIKLAEHREKDERFVYGWLKNRVII